MIGGVRRILNAPFARPPGRETGAGRFAPEIATAAVYAVLLAATGLAGASGRPDTGPVAAGWAYLVGSLLMTVLPAWFGAQCLSRERALGTLEALLLLPVGRRELAWGRFGHVIMAWLPLALWMLPLHVICSLRMGAALGGLRESSLALVFWASAPGPILGGFLVVGPQAATATPPDGLAYALLGRLASDSLGILTAAAAGLYVGARVRHGAGAVLLSVGVALGLGLGVFGAQAWAIVLLDLATGSGRPPGYLTALCGVWSVLSALGQVLAIRRLVRGAARGLAPEAGEAPGATAERPD